MNYQAILNIIEKDLVNYDDLGKVADYIPELAFVPRHKFGMNLACISGKNFGFGDYEETFSIQSISKVFTLALAKKYAKGIWKRVDVEPSGNAFNSLMQLEQDKGIPRNPFINSGALVISDILVSTFDNPKQVLLDFVHEITNDTSIAYDEEVAASEKKTGYRNVALVNYMKALGNIRNEVDLVLDFYFHQCSLAMSCKQLANAFMVFANDGILLHNNKQILKENSTKRINALMQTCGFYDEAGEFSFRVGLPGKSGVGGGIVAIHPDKYSVAVWSPPLNKHGNSEKGMKALEELTSLTGLSIF
ncbi:glutaminase [Mesonia sp. HuA40]|uniref:glutaminase n=1 Tax=Mesonia sp. HuA40 TaxID=2602761 RepID=UPI0011C92592|nr:glutaminase [Mesonia sp. HuA40]TXK73635.1 glutaminase [Mesonia sp. HuA40]